MLLSVRHPSFGIRPPDASSSVRPGKEGGKSLHLVPAEHGWLRPGADQRENNQRKECQ